MHKKLWKRVTCGCMAALLASTALSLWPPVTAQAANSSTTNFVATLTVDMSKEQGEITHGASGFLYGVSNEDVPTTNTIIPLNAKVLATKGALGTEHPYGDALDVAKTFLEAGGEQIMMYNSNYYGVFGVMTDYKIYAEDLKNIIAPAVYDWKQSWKKEHGTPDAPKDAVGARVDIDKAIIYVPVNEGTPNWGAEDFGVAWKAYYEAIKKADKDATIAGTNDWYYNRAFGFVHEREYEVENIPETATPEETSAIVQRINAAEAAARAKDENGNDISYNLDRFLPYCIEHNCMPDIITWHELDEDALVKMADHKADFTSKWNKYWKEAIDGKKAGNVTKVPEVPQIVINEYATGYDCGIPGRLVNWIARLEDNGLYGCLPFWHQANDLNDLAAEANEGNGAWWAFKWYGDMSGERLAVKTSAYYGDLYGLATIDNEKENAKVLFGGQDGTSSIELKNLKKTDLFKKAEYVHIKAEAASFVGMEGSEYAPPVIIDGDFKLDADGNVSISIQNMKFSTAYILTVTPADATEASDYLTSSYINYYEAERAQISGNASAVGLWADSGNYYGPTKYLSNDGGVLMKQGGILTYVVEVPVDGRYKLTYVYGNGTGTLRNEYEKSIGINQIQTMSVDGAPASEMMMKNTLLTNNTGNHVEYVDLAAGVHTITVSSTDATEKGEVLHDVLVVSYDSAYGEGAFGLRNIYEAEVADFNVLTSNNTYKTNRVSSVKKQASESGYSGSGYVTGLSDVSVVDGGGIRWTVVVEESGLYNMELRYQSDRSGEANLYVGNTVATLTSLAKTLPVKKTDGKWKTASSTVYLQKGINIVDLDATVDIALDYLQVKQLSQEETDGLTWAIEAEDCIPAGADIKVGASAGASGNKYVTSLAGAKDARTTPGKYLEFTYTAPAEGDYQMQVFQSNDELCGSHGYNTKIIDKYMSVSVTDKDGKETSDKRYFFINTYSRDTFKEKTIKVHLSKGENKIRLYNDDSMRILHGGSQSVAGTKVLVNTTPNLDRFIITPQSLENAVKQKTEYAINIRTTLGGYAASAQNTVEEGGTFDVTIVPKAGIERILVNGKDNTDAAVKQTDGTYTLAVKNVKADVDIQIYFKNVNVESTDDYIVNPGFGTGDDTGWTAKKVNVNHAVADSYDGYHADMNKESSLTQSVTGIPTGKYYLGVYSKGSKDAEGKVKLKATIKSGKDVVSINEKEINLGNTYLETITDFWIAEGMELEISIDTSDLKAGTVYLDDFSIKAVPARDYSKVDSSVLYFVDCGDNNEMTLPQGELFGARNSVTDQYYGMDKYTGYKWGVATTAEDYPVDPSDGSAGIWTKWQTTTDWNNRDESDKNNTFRSTAYQTKANNFAGDSKYIRYAFELEPGEYQVETGYYNKWGSCWGGDVTVKGNGSELETFNMGEVTDHTDIAVSRTVTVKVDEKAGNELNLSYERDVNGGTLYISYIKITKVESAVADLSKLKQLYDVVSSLSNKENSYEENSWNTLQAAIAEAKKYLDRESVQMSEQKAVDECTRTLENAVHALRTTEAISDADLLYFVDCGDRNPRTVSSDAKLGSLQGSLTDQVFAPGIDTEYSWGLYDKNGTRNGYEQGDAVATKWINSKADAVDGSSVTDSLVFAEGQDNAIWNGGLDEEEMYITYKFQMPEAEEGVKYPVEVGLNNTWNNAFGPVVYTNYDTDKRAQLSVDGFEVAGGTPATVKGEAEVVDGYITIDLRVKPEENRNLTIQLTHIVIEKPKKETVTLTDLKVTAPDKTQYEIGEEPKLSGMEVTAVYSDGTERKLSENEYTIRGLYTTVAGERKATVSYREGTKIVTKTFAYNVKGQGEIQNRPFEDVDRETGDWYYDAVYYNFDREIMNGVDKEHFEPLSNLARAQFAIILHNMEKNPGVDYEPKFKDVEDKQWYTNAIMWASSKEIVTGYEDGSQRFGWGDNILREQMAVMMYRYAKNFKKYDVSDSADFDKFEDATSVSEYAKEAMKWAVGAGIITGKYEGTKIDPQGYALRAECAIIIQRFLDKYAE